MLFLAGFPESIYNDLIRSLSRSLPKGEKICGVPSETSDPYDFDYVQYLIETLIELHKIDESCFKKGLAILAYRPFKRKSIYKYSSHFSPFSILREVGLDRQIAKSGAQLRRDKNELNRECERASKNAIKTRNSVHLYMENNRNRTPLLLPIRHFESDELRRIVCEAWNALQSNDDVPAIFSRLEKSFEREHPFKKGKGRTGYFVNSKDIEFKSPGRYLHGTPHLNLGEHKEACFLNGVLRIGGAIKEGFHYDCTRKNDGKYSGNFENCHGETVSKKGDPHLNVYPNDYIR